MKRNKFKGIEIIQSMLSDDNKINQKTITERQLENPKIFGDLTKYFKITCESEKKSQETFKIF